jgi:hypothetical protein
MECLPHDPMLRMSSVLHRKDSSETTCQPRPEQRTPDQTAAALWKHILIALSETAYD